MKLRMLNGSHSFLAYLGYLAAMKPLPTPWLTRIIAKRPSLDDAGTSANAVDAGRYGPERYATLLIERFSNPSLRHRTWRLRWTAARSYRSVCWTRCVCPAKRRQLASPGAGRGWLDAFTQGVDEQGNAIDVVDPMLAGSRRSTRSIRAQTAWKRCWAERYFCRWSAAECRLCWRSDGAYQQLCERGARECVAAL